MRNHTFASVEDVFKCASLSIEGQPPKRCISSGSPYAFVRNGPVLDLAECQPADQHDDKANDRHQDRPVYRRNAFKSDEQPDARHDSWPADQRVRQSGDLTRLNGSPCRDGIDKYMRPTFGGERSEDSGT